VVYDDEAERHKAEAKAARETRRADERRKGAHCGNQGCVCTHNSGCYKGWIDSEYATEPCPVCRPGVYERLKAGLMKLNKG